MPTLIQAACVTFLLLSGCDLLGRGERRRRQDLDRFCVDGDNRPFAYHYPKSEQAGSDGCVELYSDRPAEEHGHFFCCKKLMTMQP